MTAYYWTAAVGDSGFQDLDPIGQTADSDAVRDVARGVGKDWTDQREPTFALVKRRGRFGAYLDLLSTNSRDRQGRSMSARVIAVFDPSEAQEVLPMLAAMFARAEAPQFELRNQKPTLPTGWEATVDRLGVEEGAWPAEGLQTHCKERADFAKMLLVLGADSAALGRESGDIALYSNFLDTDQLPQVRDFRVVGGRELRARVVRVPKAPAARQAAQPPARPATETRRRSALTVLALVLVVAVLLILWGVLA